jgi:MFS transporter, DHA1 family, multidrug resistance protein
LSALVTIEGREIGLGTTMSVMEASMSLGMIVGPLFSGTIIELFSMKPMFLVNSVITVMGTAAFFYLMKRTGQR